MNILPLTQVVTYWLQDSVDGNGTATWKAGVKVNARWVNKDGVVTDSQGRNQKSTHVVYSETLIPKRAKVYLGDASGDLEPRSDSKSVIDSIDNPSLTSLKKMML